MEKLYDFNDIPNKVKMGLDKLFTYTHPKKFSIKKRKLLFKKIRKQQRRKTLKYINNSFKKPNSFYSKLLKQILKKNNY